MSKSVDRKVRHVIQALISAFLLFFQYMPVAGPWFGLMIFPLAAYVFGFFWSLPEFRGDQIYLLLFSPRRRHIRLSINDGDNRYFPLIVNYLT